MKKKGTNFPTKNTLNLCIIERKSGYVIKFVSALILLSLAIAAFTKFGVIDRITMDNAAWREVKAVQSQLDKVYQITNDYDIISTKYLKYSSVAQNKSLYIDCMDVIDLINVKLMTDVGVKSFSLSKNTLSAVLTGIDLNQASEILKSLYESELVSSVEFQTASSLDGDISSISMNITLNTSKADKTGGGDGE